MLSAAMPPQWGTLLTSILGETEEIKLHKALKRTVKLALSENEGEGSKKVLAGQLQELLSRQANLMRPRPSCYTINQFPKIFNTPSLQ